MIESAGASTRKSSSNSRRKRNKQERLKQQSAANHDAKKAPQAPQTPTTTDTANTTGNTKQENLGRGKRIKTKTSKQMENESNNRLRNALWKTKQKKL